MNKGVCDYDSEQKQELLKVFLELLGKGDTITGAMRTAVTLPCSRYWISIERAMRYISHARKGEWHKVRKRRMIESIMERCNGDFSRDSIENVIYGGAPEFFLTPASGQAIIYNEIKARRCRQRSQKRY